MPNATSETHFVKAVAQLATIALVTAASTTAGMLVVWYGAEVIQKKLEAKKLESK